MPDNFDSVRTSGTYQEWLAAVRGLQKWSPSGTHRVVFFVNIAPEVCEPEDRFFDGLMRPLNEFLVATLSQGGTPVVSVYDRFKKYRPSQMPQPNGHSLGNTNRLKASTLFDFLRDYLPLEIPLLGEDVGPAVGVSQ